MKKFKIEMLLVLAAVVIGGSIWAIAATEPARKAKKDTQKLIDFAQRQALEIAIIEQSVKLKELKQKLAEEQKPVSALTVPIVKEPIPEDIE